MEMSNAVEGLKVRIARWSEDFFCVAFQKHGSILFRNLNGIRQVMEFRRKLFIKPFRLNS
jgi:hypothetical protein